MRSFPVAERAHLPGSIGLWDTCIVQDDGHELPSGYGSGEHKTAMGSLTGSSGQENLKHDVAGKSVLTSWRTLFLCLKRQDFLVC
jgi:hypothetical protein